MQEENQEPPETQPLELDFKSLSLSCGQESPVTSPLSSSIINQGILLPPFYSPLGDYIGSESCLDLSNNINEDGQPLGIQQPNISTCCTTAASFEPKKAVMKQKKEFPPPIPFLARMENLPSHMPWVLKRHYTGDGRLILTEEKVRHHEYFRIHRANGRLTLQLVPLDDDDLDDPPPSPQSPCVYDDEEELLDTQDEVEDAEETKGDYGIDDDDEEMMQNQRDIDDIVKEEVTINGDDGVKTISVGDGLANNVESDNERMSPSIGAANGSAKCFKFNSIASTSSCIFGVPVPAIRTIHS